jgi:hypothetical protein
LISAIDLDGNGLEQLLRALMRMLLADPAPAKNA